MICCSMSNDPSILSKTLMACSLCVLYGFLLPLYGQLTHPAAQREVGRVRELPGLVRLHKAKTGEASDSSLSNLGLCQVLSAAAPYMFRSNATFR